MRAVLDPNVLIAALLSPQGTPARILQAWLQGNFELVISPKLIAELARALRYSKIQSRISEDAAQEFTDLLVRLAMNVIDPTTPPRIQSSDPGDDYLIALAAESSSVLVSGDGHLLKMSSRLPVYSPADFFCQLVHEGD